MKNNKKHYRDSYYYFFALDRPGNIFKGGVALVFVIENHRAGTAGDTVCLEIAGDRPSRFLKVDLCIRLRHFPIVLFFSQTFSIVHDFFHGRVQGWKFNADNIFILNELNMGCITGNRVAVDGVGPT